MLKNKEGEPEKYLGNKVNSAVSELFNKPTVEDDIFDSVNFYLYGIGDQELINKINTVVLILDTGENNKKVTGDHGNKHILDQHL